MTERRTTRAGRKPASRGGRGDVVVRMYHVGFGDAFLIRVPTAERTAKILVDCGVHQSGTIAGRPISTVARRIVEDAREDDGVARIDLVVATHRHQDHVSGFRDGDLWSEVEVKEVWMPWTEDPIDPRAREIRERQSAVARRLCAALTALGPPAAGSDAARALSLAENSLTNADAMETLHDGFAGRPKRAFLPKKLRDENSFEVECIPGLTAHVLGPTRTEDGIRDMDPPKGHSYLRRAESAAADSVLRPFQQRWTLDADSFPALSPRDRTAIEDAGDGDDLAVAVALEKAVNGTSLMIVFEIGRARLLFPGDAQWGTWSAALADPEWAALLARTNFYKVGHHGSHNATPTDFVEGPLSRNVAAMVPVKPVAKWQFIPKQELLDALRAHDARVVRSDTADVADAPGFTRTVDGDGVTLTVETRVPI